MSSLSRPVSVRRLRTGDLDRWRGLWDGYLSFYRATVTEEVTGLSFQRLCAGQPGMLGLVAVAPDDEPIGLAHLVFHATTWSAADYCYLEDLYVDRSHRGAGVAGKLIEAAYEHAREHGSHRVYWNTQQFNGAARSLYDTVGALTSFVVYEHMVD